MCLFISVDQYVSITQMHRIRFVGVLFDNFSNSCLSLCLSLTEFYLHMTFWMVLVTVYIIYISFQELAAHNYQMISSCIDFYTDVLEITVPRLL
jgi:hypothetical protein